MAGTYVTTHVLDTARGRPGDGMRIDVSRWDGSAWLPLKSTRTNSGGRTDEPLVAAAEFEAGLHRVSFHVGEYFASHGVPTADVPYLDQVPVEVHLSGDGGHYHVPLIVSPWGYTTYRGG
jgi:5-hydroxyisourate hydrolase